MRGSGKNPVWTVILIVALIGAIGCVGLIGWKAWKDAEAQRQYEELQNQVKTSSEQEPESEGPTLSELEQAAYDLREGDEPIIPTDVKTNIVQNPIDFGRLKDLNPDLYAWITIDGTVIDYPVAQNSAGDNTYYLHHNMYGQYQFAGCIFTEYPNARDFSDPLTVMYGHNMRNGSMFHALHSFLDRDFFDSHESFYVYTATNRYTYRIFAAYLFDDRHLLNTAELESPNNFEKYLNEIKTTYSVTGNYRDVGELNADSRILTLSTCVGGDHARRCLVQAVLVNNEQTK